MKEIGVGILGFGTVGAGVAEGLLRNRKLMAERLGVDIGLKKIADLDITTDRGITVPEGVLTTDAPAVIADPGVMSRSAIFFKTISTPSRSAISFRLRRRPSATPAPTVPKPSIPTPISFMFAPCLVTSGIPSAVLRANMIPHSARRVNHVPVRESSAC